MRQALCFGFGWQAQWLGTLVEGVSCLHITIASSSAFIDRVGKERDDPIPLRFAWTFEKFVRSAKIVWDTRNIDEFTLYGDL